jgi:hypothetical protein
MRDAVGRASSSSPRDPPELIYDAEELRKTMRADTN